MFTKGIFYLSALLNGILFLGTLYRKGYVLEVNDASYCK